VPTNCDKRKPNVPNRSTPASAFRPREVIPGLPPEANRELYAMQLDLRRALEMLAGAPRPTTSELQDRRTYYAKAFEGVRMDPPAAGFVLVLPDAAEQPEGAYIVALLESVASGGAVTVQAIDSLVNGQASITLDAVGAFTFYANRDDGWFIDRDTEAVAAEDLPALAGDGLVWDAVNEHLDVQGSTSIVVTGDQVQRAAVTGDVTIAQNSNAAAFRSFTARSVLANATNAGSVPVELQASATGHLFLKTNSAGNALVFEAAALAAFPTIASDTFLANITGSTAVPTAVTFTSVAGTGLTWDGTANQFDWDGLGIRENTGTTFTRRRINILDTTSIAASVVDDSGSDEVDVQFTIADRDYGDITVTTTGTVWTIDNNAITTVKILDANVTNAKLANMAQATFKGRAAGAGTGVPGDLTATEAATILEPENFVWTGTHEFDNDAVFDDLVDIGHQLHFTGVFSDLSYTSTNNVTIGNVTVARFRGVSAGQELRGLVPPAAGIRQLLWLSLEGNMTLVHASASATSTNRIFTPGGKNILSDSSGNSLLLLLFYDGGQWYVIYAPPPAPTKAQLEQGTVTDRYVTPALQQHHPSASKAWCKFQGSDSGVFESYNVSSVVNDSTGRYTVNITTDLADTGYAVFGCAADGEEAIARPNNSLVAAGSAQVVFRDPSNAGVSPTRAYVVVFSEELSA
jgi:hypothetical protein